MATMMLVIEPMRIIRSGMAESRGGEGPRRPIGRRKTFMFS